jgi:hypothetical protein
MWSDTSREILERSEDYRRTWQPLISTFVAQSTACYASETDGFIAELRGSAITAEFASGLLDQVRAYLEWLQWLTWNVATLAPLVEDGLPIAAQRFGLAALAYAGGRLVDDGIDGHLSFKGGRHTVVASVSASLPLKAEAAGAQSVFIGFCAFQRVLRRLHDLHEPELARTIGRLFAKIASGILAESQAPPLVGRAAYESVVRRKAVAYNMILSRALLVSAPTAPRLALLRCLHELDFLAQLMNDRRDEAEDRARGQLNAFVCGAYDHDAYPALVRGRLSKLWGRASSLSPTARGAVAALLAHLIATLDEPSPPRLPSVVPGIEPRHLSAAIDDGLAFLAERQKVTGEFTTCYGVDTRLSLAVRRESPFVTAMVLLALSRIAGAVALPLVRRAVRYLSSARRADGTVCFLIHGIDPDLDDTALVNWAVQTYGGGEFAELAGRLADMDRRSGLFSTWLRSGRDEPNDVDPCVSANVVRFLERNGHTCTDTVRALAGALDDDRYDHGTLYYESPVALPYLTSSLPKEVTRALGDEAAWQRRCDGLLARHTAGELNSTADIAMLVTLACAVGRGDATTTLLNELLGAQLPQGGWPPCAVFRAFRYWGSAALSTALAVEALSAAARLPSSSARGRVARLPS